MELGILLPRGAADASTSEWLDKRLPGNQSLASILAGSSKNIALAHVLTGIAKENGAVLSFFDPKKEEQKLSQLKEDQKNIPLQSELLEKLKKSCYMSRDRIYSEILITLIIETSQISIYPTSQIVEMVKQFPDFLTEPFDGTYPERVTYYLSDIIQHVKESFYPLEKLNDFNVRIRLQEYCSPGIEFADLSQKLSVLDQLKNDYSELSSVLSVPDVSSISTSSSPSSFSYRAEYHETNIMVPLENALHLLRRLIVELLPPESVKGFDLLSSTLAKVSFVSSKLNLSQFDIQNLAFALALLDWKFKCVEQIVDLELMKQKERYYALSKAELKIRSFGNFI